MGELVGKKVEAFDLDDTLVKVEYITRLGEYIGGSIRSGKEYLQNKINSSANSNLTLETLPPLDFTPEEIIGFNKLSYLFHRKRVAFPGVSERLTEKANQNTYLIAISGRPATKEWVRMTENQLWQQKIPINNIILTPRGTSIAIFKAVALKNFDVDEYTDNDGRMIYFLANLFPNKQFNYVCHSLTTFKQNDKRLARLKNLNIIPFNDWVNP